MPTMRKPSDHAKRLAAYQVSRRNSAPAAARSRAARRAGNTPKKRKRK